METMKALKNVGKAIAEDLKEAGRGVVTFCKKHKKSIGMTAAIGGAVAYKMWQDKHNDKEQKCYRIEFVPQEDNAQTEDQVELNEPATTEQASVEQTEPETN